MSQKKPVVCGVDVHKRFLQASILTSDGEYIRERFSNDLDNLFRFKEWCTRHGCVSIAVESTGVFWYPLFQILEGEIEVKVANAYHIKHIPGRKTDTIDADWIAQLEQNGLIEPSRIFPEQDRELRDFTRHRENLVKSRTEQKNRVHRVLESACIKISSVITDIFGKSGMVIIKGLLKGEDLDHILKKIPSKRVQRKEADLRGAIKSRLSQAQVLIIEQSLDLIAAFDKRIEKIDENIAGRLKDKIEDLKILMSVPGVQFVSAATLIAEIGNYKDFVTADKLASWCGITPFVYQSADKLITGKITKHGSKHLRWILVQVAQAASRTKDTTLGKFFTRIKFRAGRSKAIVALARKILCIIWHLLMNREMYIEENRSEIKQGKIPVARISSLSIQDSIDILIKAGYVVNKPERISFPGNIVGGGI